MTDAFTSQNIIFFETLFDVACIQLNIKINNLWIFNAVSSMLPASKIYTYIFNRRCASSLNKHQVQRDMDNLQNTLLSVIVPPPDWTTS
jgi:hypothetical protein